MSSEADEDAYLAEKAREAEQELAAGASARPLADVVAELGL